MAVDMVPVQSEMVNSVGYDAGSHTLFLEYRNGRIYRHAGVPEKTYAALLSSTSKGAFINKQIKPFHPHST